MSVRRQTAQQRRRRSSGGDDDDANNNDDDDDDTIEEYGKKHVHEPSMASSASAWTCVPSSCPPPLRRPPRMLAIWARLYDSVPKYRVSLPFLSPSLDVSFVVVSALALIAIRLGMMRLLLATGWPSGSKMTTDAAASLTSIVHSLLLVPGVGACLLCAGVPYVPSAALGGGHDHGHVDDDYDGRDKTTELERVVGRGDDAPPRPPPSPPPRWYRDAVSALLSLCTGYMLFDSLFLYADSVTLDQPWTDFEYMVFGHHVATILYMTSCLFVRAGHISTMALIFCGECTNPLMNGMFVTRFASKLFPPGNNAGEDDVAIPSTLLHASLEYAYACSYVTMRVVVGPAVALHLSHDLILTRRGRQNVPVWLGTIWVCLCWTVVLGSGPWIVEALGMIRDGFYRVKYHADYDYGERYTFNDEL